MGLSVDPLVNRAISSQPSAFSTDLMEAIGFFSRPKTKGPLMRDH